MAAHTCEAVVVHCMDFRLQQFLNNWLRTASGDKTMTVFRGQAGSENLRLFKARLKCHGDFTA